MELSELTAYAREKYQMEEQYKWADFPGFSILCHPQTGKWVALLMRQWDGEIGEEIQRCDMKCGRESLQRFCRPYLSPPIRMHGNKWIDIAFDDRTESEVVFQLLDLAMDAGKEQGYTIVLGSQLPASGPGCRETALPFAGSPYRPAKEKIPEQLRQMRHLYEYGRESAQARAENFYRQAVLMQDYEDNVPWSGEFFCYFPTYHDLTTRQLRGYFTWRAHLRKGEFQPIAASAAYIYIYELLNGIGAASPEDSLEKLREFEKGYLDAGYADARMRANLRCWMLDFAVLHSFPEEQARLAADPEMLEWEDALSVLRSPDTRSDEAVFSALCRIGGKKTERSPVVTNDPERGRQLFADVWRAALAMRIGDRDLFTLCFGKKRTRQWHPLSNAVYYVRRKPGDCDYILNDCRSYHCRNGLWQVKSYEKPAFDRGRFKGFLHETDARLRRSLKTGRYLKEDPADAWVIPYVDAVTEAEKRAREEAARPKITIDLSSLPQIRSDAAATRDSLLTWEEEEDAAARDSLLTWEEEEDAAARDSLLTGDGRGEDAAAGKKRAEPEERNANITLDPVQRQIVRNLLAERDVSEIIRKNHLLPSVAADAINEAFFDEIGDTVLLCEDDRFILVEDYIEDMEQLLGEDGDG